MVVAANEHRAAKVFMLFSTTLPRVIAIEGCIGRRLLMVLSGHLQHRNILLLSNKSGHWSAPVLNGFLLVIHKQQLLGSKNW